MRGIIKYVPVLALLCVILFLTASSLTVLGTPAGGSRFSGSVSVPQWEKGDKWGYKIPQYAYSSDYYGIGFEVVGTETLNGHECYKVKIWWDISYGSEENPYDYDYDVPGFEYSYRYEGYIYFTKDKLAIAKFSIDLEMKTIYDGSKVVSAYTRAQSIDYNDYSDMLEKMKKWKYDIYYSFNIDYTYDPPFVMYDYPLELNKRWNSSSLVTISWEYATKVSMSAAMKEDIKDYYGGEYPGLDEVDEEGSDSTQFTLNGEFEVTGEDAVVTDTGTHEIFVIAYDISMGFTRASYTTPPESYGSMSVPGGDATMSLTGCSAGYGKSYFDPESGYPQKMDTGSYYTESYSTVDPVSVDNTYNDKVDSKSSISDDENDDNGNLNILLILAGVIGVVIVVVVVLLMVLLKRQKRYQQGSQGAQYQSQQYPERYPQQASPQEEPYPREQQPPMAQKVQPSPPPPRIQNPERPEH